MIYHERKGATKNNTFKRNTKTSKKNTSDLNVHFGGWQWIEESEFAPLISESENPHLSPNSNPNQTRLRQEEKFPPSKCSTQVDASFFFKLIN